MATRNEIKRLKTDNAKLALQVRVLEWMIQNLADRLEGVKGAWDRCGVCGCTDNRACADGCWWKRKPEPGRPGLCSSCARNRRAAAEKDWNEGIKRLNAHLSASRKAPR